MNRNVLGCHPVIRTKSSTKNRQHQSSTLALYKQLERFGYIGVNADRLLFYFTGRHCFTVVQASVGGFGIGHGHAPKGIFDNAPAPITTESAASKAFFNWATLPEKLLVDSCIDVFENIEDHFHIAI